MNIIKAVLQSRSQSPAQVLFHHSYRRVNDNIAFTRHLIKYQFHKAGFSSKTIERHMRPISSGFDHASVLHSVKIVEAQPYIFAKMLKGLEK